MNPPVLRIGQVLIASVQGELSDRAAVALRDAVVNAFAREKGNGVVIDISGLPIVDSFLGRILVETAQMIRILGGQVVISGVSPALAITVVELGLPLEGIETALTLEEALQKIERSAWHGEPGGS